MQRAVSIELWPRSCAAARPHCFGRAVIGLVAAGGGADVHIGVRAGVAAGIAAGSTDADNNNSNYNINNSNNTDAAGAAKGQRSARPVAPLIMDSAGPLTPRT